MNANLKTSLFAVGEFVLILAVIFGGMGLVTWLLANDVNPKYLKAIGGLLFVVLGVVSLLYGDKVLNVKGGIILRTFDPKNYPAALVSRVMGLVLMTAGLILMFN